MTSGAWRRRPVRACIDELLPDVLEGGIQPGRVLDEIVDLDGVPADDQAIAERQAIKGRVQP